MNRYQKQRGVTLLELLIVAAVSSIIALAIASTFSSGIAVYSKVRNYGESRIDCFLALENLEKDLRNSFFSPEMPFVGTRNFLSFPGVSLVDDDDGRENVSLGKYRYFIDEGIQRTFKMAWVPYCIASGEDKKFDVDEEYLADIESFEVRYFFINEGGESLWVDEWDDPLLMPYGVEIKLIAKYGEEEILFQRKIFIPASMSPKEDEENLEGEEDFFDEEGEFLSENLGV